MAEARRTTEAKLDLVQISEFIANDSPQAATRWLEEMRAACELIATQPEIGQLLQSKRLGVVRRHAVGNYLIHYRPIASGVEILRVVHGARDQNKLL